MDVILDGQTFRVKPTEFQQKYHAEYNNLKIIPDLGFCNRVVGLLTDLATDLSLKNILFNGITHGGFIPIKCASVFQSVFVNSSNSEEIAYNKNKLNISNLFIDYFREIPTDVPLVIVNFDSGKNNLEFIEKYQNAIVLTRSIMPMPSYQLSGTDFNLYIPRKYKYDFLTHFHYYLEGNEFKYENLVHLAMIVKNAGDNFENILKANWDVFDRWTIYDTGSTDNTMDIINRVLVGKKKGTLYQEPFKNFSYNRNKCLEKAGHTCDYILTLDDTYIIQGDLRGFLNEVRGDQFADSYNLYIKSDDVEYSSNRIIRSIKNLRYTFKIHEVIQEKNNIAVMIPIQRARIHDHRSDYMEKRTMDRKQLDLRLLFEEIAEEPDNPRHYYYVAQTYNLMNRQEDAYEYYLKRAHHPVQGFLQEKVDAVFEAARTANFKLNKPWEECEKLYKWACDLDPSRPDSIYFLGIHYYLEGKEDIAYDYFKKGFQIGYPLHAQYSLKPTLSYHFLPKFLAPLCYKYKNFKLGLDCTSLFLEKNISTEDQYEVMRSWNVIFKMLCIVPDYYPVQETKKPIFCIMADGGFKKWTGSDILTKGMGGSETWVIETATALKKYTNYDVYVFCNCEKSEVFRGVNYLNINEFFLFTKTFEVEHCIISRYSEYVPAAIHSYVKNVYLILHDLGPSGCIIPVDPKLKKIFCLTDWHKEYFLKTYPQFADRTESCHYGLDFTRFNTMTEKVNHSFIYSSFPNRGLAGVLRIWKYIRSRLPDAILHIYADVNTGWANDYYPAEMAEARKILEEYKGDSSVVYHGWVNKKELSEAWSRADIWFYPCTFTETFCQTALECAFSKTLAVCNDLGSLVEVVGDRGIMIPGTQEEVRTEKWLTKAVDMLCLVLEDKELKRELLERNFQWALTHTWAERTFKLTNMFEN